jgi:predicted RNA-binding Zn ribbon-like protein
VIDVARAAKLEAAAVRAPREATVSLGRARKVREALHDVFVALLAGKAKPPGAIADIEGAWKRASTRAHLAIHDRSLQLQPDPDRSGLDLPLDVVIFAAVDLLGEIDTERTRVCRGTGCGWLFIDSSKGGRRVWCDMATCGNTAKSERFARAAKRRRKA